MLTIEIEDNRDCLVERGWNLLKFNQLLKLETSLGNLGITELSSNSLNIFAFVYDYAFDILVFMEFSKLRYELHFKFFLRLSK